MGRMQAHSIIEMSYTPVSTYFMELGLMLYEKVVPLMILNVDLVL